MLAGTIYGNRVEDTSVELHGSGDISEQFVEFSNVPCVEMSEAKLLVQINKDRIILLKKSNNMNDPFSL